MVSKKFGVAGRRRSLTGAPRVIAFILGISLTCFVFYTAVFGVMLPFIQRSINLFLVLAMIFLWYPAFPGKTKSSPAVLDWLFFAFCLFGLVWTLSSVERFQMRIPFVGKQHPVDIAIAIVTTLLILEAGRRTLGLVISIITAFFLAYAFFASYFPAMFAYKGLTLSRFVDQVYMTTEGFFSSLSGMSATLLFAFVAFGTFLQVTGVDKYFMDISIAAAGHKIGGPAKVAVLSSAAMGTISGSSIANVVTTGTLTIPLMKKTGYTPEEAAAIETAASTGGQIMPPIMGTGAFILAEAVGVSYSKVMMVSIIPAILFYLSVYILVDLKAKKRGLKGLPKDSIPNLAEALRKGGLFFIPIAVLILLLAFNFTPFLSAVACTFMIVVFAFLRKETRPTLRQLLIGLEQCAVAMTSMTGIILCASLIVAMINITGLMMKTTAIILSLSGGVLPLTILLIAAIAYVLGMGLPIATSYVILSTLGAPALVELGVPMLNAHLMIFWFTQLATITPPVCMTAFAAASIAEANPMKTGFTALLFGAPFYYIPILFVYSGLIGGHLFDQLIISVLAMSAIYFLAVGTIGYFRRNASIPVRLVSFTIFLMLYVSAFNAFGLPVRLGLLSVSIVAVIIIWLIQGKPGKDVFQASAA
jgi:TRAP transporter 4TM/12TM fusion protein